MKTLKKPDWVDVGGGVKRRIVADGAHLMQVEVFFSPGAEGALHSHPHEQTTVVLEGGGVYYVEDVKHSLRAGDVIHVPPNACHGFIAIPDQETVLLDTFSPPREDFR